jgi:hypothetical protein
MFTLASCLDFEDRVRELCRTGALDCASSAADGGGASGDDSGAGFDGGAGGDGGTDAGDSNVDGGTSAGDGGSASDGGGMSDAGFSGDRGGAIDGGLLACSGSDGWCWENPSALPAVNLHAVWGTSDTDVWVAGAGRMLSHWDGARWTDERSRIPLYADDGLLAEEPAVLGQMRGSDGRLWFAARPSALVQASDGGLVRLQPPYVSGQAIDAPIAVAARGADVWLLTGSGRVHRPSAASVDVNLAPILGSFGATAFLPTDDGCFLIAISRYNLGVHAVARCDGGVSNLTYDGGEAYPHAIDAFALGPDGGYLAGGGLSDILESNDGVTWTPRAAGQSVTPFHSTNHILSFPDGGRWFLGQEGQIFDLGGVLVRPPTGLDLHAAWLSPEGTVWAVGEAGTVVRRFAASEGWDDLGPKPMARIMALSVGEAHQVAAGREGLVLTRGWSGRWDKMAPSGMTTSDTVVSAWVAASGRIALGTSSGKFWLDAAVGTAASFPEGGANVYVGAASEREFFLGGGRTIMRFRDGGILDPISAGSSGAITGLSARSGDEVFVSIDLDVAESVAVRGQLAKLQCNSETSPCMLFSTNLPQPPNDVSVTPHSAWVAGPHSMIGFLDGGVFQSEWPEEGQPQNLDFTSTWASEDGGVWIVTDFGAVLRRTGPKTWVRERPGFGTTRGAPGLVRIRGNSTDLYLVGHRGAVLRRSR